MGAAVFDVVHHVKRDQVAISIGVTGDPPEPIQGGNRGFSVGDEVHEAAGHQNKERQ